MASPTPSARELFDAAAALAAADREAFLRRACPDPALRAEVEQLLAADARGTGFLDAEPTNADMLVGRRLGPFEIVRLVGRGGMGVVYEARQAEPARTVALKLMHGGFATPETVARFRREAELLARVEHPNIIRLYAAGHLDIEGRPVPYLALEFVRDGAPLLEFVRSHDTPRRERLQLFAAICRAVAYGHDLGIVHRDLKPGNVLVDGKGTPHVVDFGIARALATDGPEAMTLTSQVLGTPRYMSPEQLRGDHVRIDRRTDVWALGVMLHELLTSAHPFRFDSQSLPAIARAVEQQEPLPLGRVDRTLRGDLEIVVARALAKEPTERYASAGELADEIARVLGGEPIAARRDHTLYVLRKRMARHRLALGAGGFVTLAASIAAVVSLSMWRRAEDAGEATRQTLYWNRIALAAGALESQRFAEFKAHLAECEDRYRGWEWRHLAARTDDSVWRQRIGQDPVRSLAVSAGAVVAVGGNTGTVVLLDAATGAEVAAWDAHRSGVPALAFLPGEPAQLVTGSWDRTAKLWRLDDRELQREWRHDEEVWCVAIAPDGTRLATGDRAGIVRLFALGADAPLQATKAHPGGVTALAFAHGGDTLASGGTDRTICLWRVADGTLAQRITKSMRRENSGLPDVDAHGAAISGLVFHKNDRFLYSGSHDGVGKMWSCGSGELLFFETLGARLGRVALQPDGTVLAIAANSRVLLRSTLDARPFDPLQGHETDVGPVAFTPDGNLLIAAAADGWIRAFDPTRRGGSHAFAKVEPLGTLGVAGDGSLLVAGGSGGRLTLFRGDDLTALQTFRAHGQAIRSAAVDATGQRFVATADDRTMSLWHLPGPRQVAEVDVPYRGRAIWHAQGIFVAGDDRHLTLHAHEDLQPKQRWQVAERVVKTFDVDAAGHYAAIGTESDLRLWDLTSGSLVATWPAHEGREIRLVSFRLDGTLVSGGADGTLRGWSLPGASLVAEVHVAQPVHLAPTSDADRLLVSPMRGNPRLVRLAGGATICELLGHDAGVIQCGLVALGDGRFVSGDSSGVLRVWSDRDVVGRR